jgi:hypothetical protein
MLFAIKQIGKTIFLNFAGQLKTREVNGVLKKHLARAEVGE